MTRRLSSFQTLALWTTATTYFLILVGGLVRASGAGLGCPDWPRCFGSWVPPASADALPPEFDPAQFNAALMWTEYLNRLLGVTVGLLILATLVSAWRHHRQTPRIIWPTLAAFLLVGFQGWLGGVVVQQELASWIVTLHMLVALIIVSLLLYATVYAFFPSATARAYRERRWLTVSGAVLIAITLVQITVGTQVREHIDTAIDRGVPRDQALATAGNYDWWHRDLAAVVLVVTLWMLAITLSHHRAESAIVRTAGIVIVLVGVQVVFGVAMAYGGLIAPAQIAHLTVASLLLGAETVLVLLARWSPVRNS